MPVPVPAVLANGAPTITLPPSPATAAPNSAPAWEAGLPISSSRLPKVGCVGSPAKAKTSPEPESVPGAPITIVVLAAPTAAPNCSPPPATDR